VTVVLQFDRDDLARRCEGRQEIRKAAVDRSHGAVEEGQRGPVAMDLVVRVEPVHRHVTARCARLVVGVCCWHGTAPFSAVNASASLPPARGIPRGRSRPDRLPSHVRAAPDAASPSRPVLASLIARGEYVGEIHDSAVVGLRAGECELGYRAAVREQPPSGAVCQREYEQMQLVDQAVGEHRLNQAAAAADVDVAVDFVLEVTDLVRVVGAKDDRVVSLSGLQRG
jgi:hypothetical protein